jgi:hypothetical protein
MGKDANFRLKNVPFLPSTLEHLFINLLYSGSTHDRNFTGRLYYLKQVVA